MAACATPGRTNRTASASTEGASHQPQPDAAQVDQVAHLSLQVGRLLLSNGADTQQVEVAVARFAASFGCEAHLLVSYEAVLLTILANGHFRTKIGYRIPVMNVGMAVVGAVNRLVDDVASRQDSLTEAGTTLLGIEQRPADYSRWLVVVALGLTAACLSRLFGGDWPAFGVAWLAGMVGTWLRQEMGRLHLNPILVAFTAACVSGTIGGAAVHLHASVTPALCLVAPGMIIVPGVPFINGIQDMIRNHVTLGISRLGFASLITIAIALGLVAAMVATGISIPLDAPARAVGIPEDAAFSALAAIGYALLFNVPARLTWACVLCGVASHTTRTLCVHLGIDIVAGTLIGALVVGFLAQGLAIRFHAPAAAFAFPGVVAMIPGAYAFGVVIGSLQIVHATAAPQLVTETIVLGATVMFMLGAIAIGIALPAVITSHRRH